MATGVLEPVLALALALVLVLALALALALARYQQRTSSAPVHRNTISQKETT